eukprot:c18829_g1_i1.p1 GENE.c18829_g1_i1~~c18829_g1_i1.p1  ORF type:complete len:645 (+),score=141.29 c18829_g1_i1:43-1935(+)
MSDPKEFRVVTYVVGALSLVGSSVLISTLLMSKKLFRVPALKLLFYVSTLSWLEAIADFLSASSDADLCRFVGFLKQFSNLGAALWMGCLAFNQYRGIVHGKSNPEKNEIFFHLISWGIPTLTSIILFGLRAFGSGDDLGWCWISDAHQVARWVLFHIPIVLILLVMTGTVFLTLRSLNRYRSRAGSTNAKKGIFRFNILALPLPRVDRTSDASLGTISTMNIKSNRVQCATISYVELKVQRQMIYLTFLFVIIRLPNLIKAAATVHSDSQIRVLVFLDAFFTPLQGFLVFSLFLCNSQVRRHYRRLQRKYLTRQQHDPTKRLSSHKTIDPEIPLDKEVLVDELDKQEADSATLSSEPQRSLRVFVGSWNLGNAAPPNDLSDWIPTSEFDIWVIGAQESSWAGDRHSSVSDLLPIVQNHLSAGSADSEAKNVTLACVAMWDIRMIVVVSRGLNARISNLSIAQETCGIAKVLGNKGAVGVSFTVDDSTTVAFINCHLAARANNVHKRNLNVRDIVRGMRLGRRRIELTQQFHYLFWLGDLNYRVNIPRQTAIQHVEAQDYGPLLLADQLKREMDAGKIFQGFREAEITFAPTYRYERGSCQFSNKKNQVTKFPFFFGGGVWFCLLILLAF